MSGPPTAAPRPLAVVTGASSGIGAAFAASLAARGNDLLLVARREDRLQRAVAALSAAHGIDAAYCIADLASESGVETMIRRVREGRTPDVLVNNAGFGSHAAVIDVETDVLRRMLRLNVEAVLVASREIGADMAKRGSGVILNIASTAAFQPLPWFGVYGATKAFVLHFSEALHDELHGRVRVLAVCPGYTETEFQGSSAMDGRFDKFPKMSAEAVVADALRALDGRGPTRVVGRVNRLQVALATKLPRGLVRRMAARIFRRDPAG